MHNLSLGISRLLEECLRNMLGDELRETCAIRTVSSSSRTFKSVRNAVLLILKDVLADSQKRHMGSAIRLDYKKPGQTNQLNCLLTETGLTEMI